MPNKFDVLLNLEAEKERKREENLRKEEVKQAKRNQKKAKASQDVTVKKDLAPAKNNAPSTVFRCAACGVKSNSEAQYNDHLSSKKHKAAAENFCFKCEVKLSSTEELRQHVKDVHVAARQAAGQDDGMSYVALSTTTMGIMVGGSKPVQTDIPADGKQCQWCAMVLPKSSFSKNQWKKPDSQRRCMSCTEAENTGSVPASLGPAPRGFVAPSFRDDDDYRLALQIQAQEDREARAAAAAAAASVSSATTTRAPAHTGWSAPVSSGGGRGGGGVFAGGDHPTLQQAARMSGPRASPPVARPSPPTGHNAYTALEAAPEELPSGPPRGAAYGGRAPVRAQVNPQVFAQHFPSLGGGGGGGGRGAVPPTIESLSTVAPGGKKHNKGKAAKAAVPVPAAAPTKAKAAKPKQTIVDKFEANPAPASLAKLTERKAELHKRRALVALHEALHNGDVAGVIDALKDNASPNKPNPEAPWDPSIPLAVACAAGNEDMVRCLLAMKKVKLATTFVAEEGPCTPLDAALKAWKRARAKRGKADLEVAERIVRRILAAPQLDSTIKTKYNDALAILCSSSSSTPSSTIKTKCLNDDRWADGAGVKFTE